MTRTQWTGFGFWFIWEDAPAAGDGIPFGGDIVPWMTDDEYVGAIQKSRDIGDWSGVQFAVTGHSFLARSIDLGRYFGSEHVGLHAVQAFTDAEGYRSVRLQKLVDQTAIELCSLADKSGSCFGIGGHSNNLSRFVRASLEQGAGELGRITDYLGPVGYLRGDCDYCSVPGVIVSHRLEHGWYLRNWEDISAANEDAYNALAGSLGLKSLYQIRGD